MATHSTILAWRIPRTEEPGGLQFMGSQRVRDDWVTNTHTHTYIHTHTHTHTHTHHMTLFAHLVTFRRVSIRCLSCLPKSILAESQLKSLSRIVIYMLSNFHFSAIILYQGSRILPLGLCSMGIQLRKSREFPQRLVGFSLRGPLSAI